MKSAITAFNRVAAKTRQSLSHAFATAALSGSGQFVMRHAGKISGASWLAGDLLLGIDMIEPALCFIAGDVCLAISDVKKPQDVFPRLPIGNTVRNMFAAAAPHGLRMAGVSILAGAAWMSWLGRDLPGATLMHVANSVVSLQALSWIFQNELNAQAGKMEQARSAFTRAISKPLAKYPVLTSSAIDVVAKGFLAWSALQSGNISTLLATGIWVVGGDGGIVAKDNNVINWVEQKRAERAQAPNPAIA